MVNRTVCQYDTVRNLIAQWGEFNKLHLMTINRFGGSCLRVVAIGVIWAITVAAQSGQSQQVRVLLVTGGHEYDTNKFNQMFSTFEDISVRHVRHPFAHSWWRAERSPTWDVLVLYDMWQQIDERSKVDLLRCLTQEKKGLVVLHHALANYQNWPEYRQIIGGRYLLNPIKQGDKIIQASTYKHDVEISVQIADPTHPITRSLNTFVLRDEVYGGLDIDPDVHPLLITNTEGSSPIIAWISPWKPTRVVVIQPGHDAHSWSDENYRTILHRAILWTAGRLNHN